jgi:MSHA biogenesis protein MshQ
MKCAGVRERLGLGILVAFLVFAGAGSCLAAAETVLDTFSAVSYGNQDGTANWGTDWVEVNDNNNPSSGNISVHPGSERLRIRGRNDSTAVQVHRGLDLSQATSAVLIFDYEITSFNSWWDRVEVEISDDGGSNWTSLVTINMWSSQTGSWRGDISGYMSSNTRIRFVGSGSLSTNEGLFVDNVQITYQVPGAPQLVAHYALEGNEDDSSGNGHDGSSQGTVAFQRARVCDGVELDGSGYLQAPDNDDFDLPVELTVMAWIRADSLSASDHEDLYSFLSKDTNFEFHIQSNGTLYWWWGNGSLSSAAGLIAPQTWYHFAAVYSRSAGAMRMYLNGVSVASQSLSSLLPVNNDPFYIGTDIATGGGGEIPERRFIGTIDEVRVFSEALSAGQIADLMNEVDPCALPTPLAEWRFDECGYQGAAPLAEDAQGSYDAVAQGQVGSEPAGVVGRAAMLDLSTDSFLTSSDVPMNGDWTVSTWFRMPFTHTEGSRYHVLGSMAGGGSDLLWVDSNRGYLWGGWAGSTSRDGSFRFSTLADGWHHLAAVAENGQTNLYIDGVWRDRISLQPSGNLHFVATSYDSVGGNQGFRADLDEFLVFDGALTGTQIDTIYQLQSAGRNLDGTVREEIACGPAIDHFELIHDGSALTCSPETVTVRVCADDADPCTLYTSDVEVTLTPTGWVGDDTQILTGGSGAVRLRHTTPETVSLAVDASDPASDHGYECVDGSGGTSCNLIFYEAGFLFDVSDVTSCAQQDDIVIAAVRADATAEHCVGDDSFAGTTRSINFWSGYQQPASGTRSVSVNGTSVAGASPGTAVSLEFDDDAKSSFSVQYADAGRVQLTAHFEGSGDEADLVMEGSDSFVAVPHHLLVSAEQADGNPLNSTDPDGTYHIAAGADFVVEVSAVCEDDSVMTPNFAAATTLEAVTPFQPATGQLGEFTPETLAATDYSGGVAGDITATYSEVGTATLQAVATNYLGSGIDVSGSTVVGRFTPARFALSLYQSPELTPACSSGRFTYVGQTFGYAAEPVVKITALNVQGDVTQNYTQPGWWKITNAALLAGRSYSAATGSLDISDGGASHAYPVVGEPGSGTLTYDEDSAMTFVRGAPVAPFFADIDLQINVVDADGISASVPLSIEDIPFSGEDKTGGINTDEMRWGRLAMQNAYGSELLDLPMPLRAEYYDGSSFVTNLDDYCTNLSVSQLSLSGTVTSTATLYDNSSSSLSAGDAGLVFSAPNATGYIGVQLDLSLLPWLRYDWDGDTHHDNDPAGRATFGIYRSRPGLIYRRETYRGSP